MKQRDVTDGLQSRNVEQLQWEETLLWNNMKFTNAEQP